MLCKIHDKSVTRVKFYRSPLSYRFIDTEKGIGIQARIAQLVAYQIPICIRHSGIWLICNKCVMMTEI